MNGTFPCVRALFCEILRTLHSMFGLAAYVQYGSGEPDSSHRTDRGRLHVTTIRTNPYSNLEQEKYGIVQWMMEFCTNRYSTVRWLGHGWLTNSIVCHTEHVHGSAMPYIGSLMQHLAECAIAIFHRWRGQVCSARCISPSKCSITQAFPPSQKSNPRTCSPVYNASSALGY